MANQYSVIQVRAGYYIVRAYRMGGHKTIKSFSARPEHDAAVKQQAQDYADKRNEART